MDFFEYRDGRLVAEEVDLMSTVAEWGTPCYVYSRATLERHWHAFDNAFGDVPHLVCYAVKASILGDSSDGEVENPGPIPVFPPAHP